MELLTFYGTWGLGTLLMVGLLLARRVTVNEAATGFFSAFLTAAGIGLIATLSHESAHLGAMLLAQLLFIGGLAMAGWLLWRIRDARAGLRPPITSETAGGIFLGGITAALIPLYGIGLVLAPLTLPALWKVGRRNGPFLNAWLAAVAGLTTFLIGLVLGFLAFRDPGWVRWFSGCALGLATVVAFGRRPPSERQVADRDPLHRC